LPRKHLLVEFPTTMICEGVLAFSPLLVSLHLRFDPCVKVRLNLPGDVGGLSFPLNVSRSLLGRPALGSTGRLTCFIVDGPTL